MLPETWKHSLISNETREPRHLSLLGSDLSLLSNNNFDDLEWPGVYIVDRLSLCFFILLPLFTALYCYITQPIFPIFSQYKTVLLDV